MLISKLQKSVFLNNKKKIIILENLRKKLTLITFFLFFTSFYLLSNTNYILTESKFNFFNNLLINNGFMVKNIKISGLNYLDENEIIKIINTHNNTNIFNLNIKNIYRDIKNITWIKKASVEIIYPNTLRILLTEKKPIAIWQNRNGNNLITKTGDVIFEKKLENFKNFLPIIIGHNAHKNIYSLLEILNPNKEFVRNIWSLTFVNERRWDVHFNQGLTIRLPNKNIEDAWDKVVYLNKKFNILSLGLTEIDLRNTNQILGKINIDKNLILKRKTHDSFE